MAGNPRCDYEAMAAIAKQFLTDQNDISNLLGQTKNKVEGLHGNMWQGEAADKFFNEMEQKVIPGMNRLVHALGRFGEVTNKVSNTIQQADEDTRGYFKNLSR